MIPLLLGQRINADGKGRIARRWIVLTTVVCALCLAAAPRALASAPSQLSGTYAVTGFQVESVTPVGTNVKEQVDEEGTLAGDIQGSWFWEEGGIGLGTGSGAGHGTLLCSPCTIAGSTGSFTAVSESGAGQSSFRFTITAAYGGLAGLHGDIVTTGGATGTFVASLSLR